MRAELGGRAKEPPTYQSLWRAIERTLASLATQPRLLRGVEHRADDPRRWLLVVCARVAFEAKRDGSDRPGSPDAREPRVARTRHSLEERIGVERTEREVADTHALGTPPLADDASGCKGW
jgi:hypothetical protein